MILLFLKKTQEIIKSISILFLVFFFNSCKEETGVCTACCDENNSTYCYKDYTIEMCNQLNKDELFGLQWEFSSGAEVCPIDSPSGPN